MDESTPAGGANTVQVLVPGASYGSVYLAIDRLGSGRSSAPPSAVVTAITQAGGPLATDSPDFHRVVVRRAASMVGT